jgi:hypothetical protein
MMMWMIEVSLLVAVVSLLQQTKNKTKTKTKCAQHPFAPTLAEEREHGQEEVILPNIAGAHVRSIEVEGISQVGRSGRERTFEGAMPVRHG